MHQKRYSLSGSSALLHFQRAAVQPCFHIKYWKPSITVTNKKYNAMSGYNREEHGQHDREMFDKYVTSSDKFMDLTDKVVAITGTSVNGMGFHLAEIALKKNAKLLLCLNRDSSSAKKGFEGLLKLKEETKSATQMETVNCDLQDLENVKAAASQVNDMVSKFGGLDIVIFNSGVMATKDRRTKDGFDVQMQTNQLSHFLLLSEIWPSIKKASETRGEARVVTHSSSARDAPNMPILEPFFMKCPEGSLGGDKTWMMSEILFAKWGPWVRYHQTKLANSCLSMELHKRLSGHGMTKIKSTTADPGLASSNLQVTSTQGDGLMPAWTARMFMRGSQSAEDGSLSCALSAFGVETESGDMFMPAGGYTGEPIKCISKGVATKKGKEALTCDATNQSNTWKFSEKALGIQFHL